MNWWQTAAIAGIAWSLAACSSVKEELKPVKLESLEPSVVFKKEWNVAAGEAQSGVYARLRPHLSEGILYTVDAEGTVTAVDAAKGKRRWRVKLDTAIGGGVGSGGALLLLGGINGDVIALNKEDGSTLWKSSVSSEVMAAPQSDGKVVIVPAIDGRVFALSADDGKRLWSYDHSIPVLTLRGNSTPLLMENSVYIGFDNGQLLKFDAESGQLRWSTRVAQPEGKTEIERLIDVDTSPVAFGPYVQAASVNGRLVAVNRGTGRISWSQDLSTYHDIAVGEGKIAVSTDESHVRLFDASSGLPLWENKALHRRNIGPPAIVDGLVVVVDHEKYMHGLDMKTGELVARRRIKGQVTAQPIVADEVIYIYDVRGQLSAYSLKRKKQREQVQEADSGVDAGDQDS